MIDKTVYSPFAAPELTELLRRRGTDSLVIGGAETDVCVLAAVIDAIDRGLKAQQRVNASGATRCRWRPSLHAAALQRADRSR